VLFSESFLVWFFSSVCLLHDNLVLPFKRTIQFPFLKRLPCQNKWENKAKIFLHIEK
jgi:hypothetical protein